MASFAQCAVWDARIAAVVRMDAVWLGLEPPHMRSDVAADGNLTQGAPILLTIWQNLRTQCQ
jgi:hypothetical protein